ncbi:MAG TPA: M28 family peptidase [Flavitalea sp.]|nr:M28 family peptidase [Flavitalea sp.]
MKQNNTTIQVPSTAVKKIIFFLLFPLVSICSIAQVEQFAQTITPDDLKNHLFKIASREMQGRETATEGQRLAATYIEEQFKKDSLTPGWNGSYQQPFPVYKDSLIKAVLVINGKNLKHDTDFTATLNSGFNISMESDEIFFAGFGQSDSAFDDYSNTNVKGKIVMIWPGTRTTISGGKKVTSAAPDYYILQKSAKKNGAAALLIVQPSFIRGALPNRDRMYVKDYREDSIPDTFIISDSTARLIVGKDFESVRKSIKTDAPAGKSYASRIKLEHEKVMQQLQSSNVIGMLQGTDKKDEAVIITAHYDHLGKKDTTIYFGADDDGSGTVAVLEIAQAYKLAAAAGVRPRRTIIFMTVSGEEKGLWGSDYYSGHPAFSLDKTSADINIDMIGRIEKGRKGDSLDYIYVVGDNRLSSDLRPVSENLNNKHFKFKFDYKYNDPNDPERIFYRSDHYNFAKKGVPAIFYFSGLHDDYHRPTDTPDKIRYELLSRRAQMIFYTTWEIANRQEMLKRDLE